MKIKAYRHLQHQAIVKATETLLTPPHLIPVREELPKFITYISGLTPASHHLTWIDAIVTEESTKVLSKVSGKFLRIAAPRGSAKTTVSSLAVAWIIGHNPHIRIILTSYSDDIARAISVSIKRIIESLEYQLVFPHVRPSDRWADGNWFIDRTLARTNEFIKDPTVLAVGSGGSIASRRSDLILIDDPIKSSFSIGNPSVRAAMVKWWSEVLRPTLVPGGRVIVLCTRYRVDDLHGTTFNGTGWRVITQPAIVTKPNGEERSYWSNYITIGELQKLRAENPQAFASQYQNNPLDEETTIIRPDWINRLAVPRNDNLIVGVDLAASLKESADYTALVGASCDYPSGTLPGRNSYIYIEFARRGRFTINETINKLEEIIECYADRKITLIIEAVAYQTAFALEFKRVAVNKMLPVKIVTERPKGDKTSRLRGISGFIESGVIKFSDRSMGELIEELVSFPNAAHDDMVDALVMAASNCLKQRKPLSGGSF